MSALGLMNQLAKLSTSPGSCSLPVMRLAMVLASLPITRRVVASLTPAMIEPGVPPFQPFAA